MTTYKISLKSIQSILYPDAENTEFMINQIGNTIASAYNQIRLARIKENEIERVYDEASPTHRGMTPTEPITAKPFSEQFTVAGIITEGKNYNDVTTVDMELTITSVDNDPSANLLLSKIHVADTYRIDPSYRVTGY